MRFHPIAIAFIFFFNFAPIATAQLSIDSIVTKLTDNLLAEGWTVDEHLPPGGIASWDKINRDGEMELRHSLLRYPSGFITESLPERMIQIIPNAVHLETNIFYSSGLVAEVGFFMRFGSDAPIAYGHYREVAFPDPVGAITLMSTLTLPGAKNLEEAKEQARLKMRGLSTGLDTLFSMAMQAEIEEQDDKLTIEFFGIRHTFSPPDNWTLLESSRYLASWETETGATVSFLAIPPSQEPSDWLKAYQHRFEDTRRISNSANGRQHSLVFETRGEEAAVYRPLLYTFGVVNLVFEITEPISDEDIPVETNFIEEAFQFIQNWKVKKVTPDADEK